MPVTPLHTDKNEIDVDDAVQRLAAIEALSIMLSIAYADDNAIPNIRPHIVAAAWDGIALLAADAKRTLHATERHRIP